MSEVEECEAYYEGLVKSLNTKNRDLTAENQRLREALMAAEESIVTFMGVHNYPTESGVGDVLKQVRAALSGEKGEGG